MSQEIDRAVTEGVRIWRCTACGTGYFPQRLLCPHCRGQEFTQDRVTEGVVEEITVIRHVLGQTNWQPHRLANVRTENGPHITVGLRDESEPGTVVVLFEEGNAPFGSAKAVR